MHASAIESSSISAESEESARILSAISSAGGYFTHFRLYQLVDGRLQGLYCRRNRGQIHLEQVDLSSNQLSSKSRIVDCPTIVLVPKVYYLIRQLELPKVQPEEVPQMIGLEAGALLPPEFGEVELSYRPLLLAKEGHQKFEVYIARHEHIRNVLSTLVGFGISPDFVVPTAFVWNTLLNAESTFDLMVAPWRPGQLEAVSREARGAINIRTIEADQSKGGMSNAENAVVECIRSLLANPQFASTSLKVGWIGDDCPSHLRSARVHFERCVDGLPVPETAANTILTRDFGFLRIVAATLFSLSTNDVLSTSNLLPQNLRLQKYRTKIYRQLGIAVGSILLTLLLLFVSLRIAVYRYQAMSNELTTKIASIKTEGEAIGQQIDQINAVRAARLTRNDFHDVLAGLYESTPPGVSYSQVELNEHGEIRLHGQADSVSLPFLLPEKLESHLFFKEVLLKDAGQSKKGEGTIAEFRLECKLHREKGK